MLIRKASLAFALALGSAACSDSKTTTPPGTTGGALTGHIANDDGNEHVGPRAAGGTATSGALAFKLTSVSAFKVGDDGHLTLVGSGDVAADGSYTIDGVSGSGPFVIQGTGSGAGSTDVSGAAPSVIVPQDVGDGDSVAVMPMSHETTIEAQALTSIVSGNASASDVDTIGLMTWITANLAADRDAASLGAAYMDAQSAWIQTASDEGATVTASQLQDAETSSWTQLVGSLNAASGSSASENSAWSTFGTSETAQLQSSAQIDDATQADANAAAGLLFQHDLQATGTTDMSHRDALAIATTISAMTDWAAQRADVRSSSAATQIDAKLDAAYQAFADAIDQAQTEDAMGTAYTTLVTQIWGGGDVTATGDSALGLLIGAQSDSGTNASSVTAAINATATLSTTLQTSVDSALAGSASGRVAAVSNAYATYRAALQTALQGSLGASFATLGAFASDSASQSGGEGGGLLGLDLFGDTGNLGGTLDAVLQIGLGSQSGANGLIGTDTWNGLTTATSALLVSIDASGQSHQIASGAIDQATHSVSFQGVTAATGTLFIELFDAQNAMTGAARVDAVATTDGATTTATITQETSVEAQVALDLLRGGTADAAIDYSFLEGKIDAAIAASVSSQNDIDALADAVNAGAQTRADDLGTTTAMLHSATAPAVATLHSDASAIDDQDYATFASSVNAAIMAATAHDQDDVSTADQQSANVFASVVASLRGATSGIAQAAQARAQLDAALALQSALDADLASATFDGSRPAQLATAIQTFVTATHGAASGAQLDAASSALVDAMLGFNALDAADNGLLGDISYSDLSLTPVQVTALETAIASTFSASATNQSSIQSAISSAGGTGGGAFDASSVATAAVQSQATFETAATSALALPSLALSTADQHAIATLATQLSLGFSGSFDGTWTR